MKAKSFGAKIGALIVVVLAGATVSGLSRGAVGWATEQTVDWNARYESAVMDNPSMAPTFAAFKQEYPAEYTRHKAQMVALLADGTSADQMFRAGHEAMRAFMSSKKAAIAQAPSEMLEALRNSQLRTIEALASESQIHCANFVMVGLKPEDRPSKTVMPSIGRTVAIQIRAAAAGERQPAGRSVELSEADLDAWFSAMVDEGMSTDDIEVLAQGRLDTAEPPKQCDLGLKLMRAAASLPPDQADRITAYMAVNG